MNYTSGFLVARGKIKMESNNLASQITKFVGEKHRIVKAEEIYTAFKEEFSDGQIAGVLRRLRTTGRLVSPKRGYYENTMSSNVLAELVKDISNLIQKYNTSAQLMTFLKLPKKLIEKIYLISHYMGQIQKSAKYMTLYIPTF
jgi:hypothetical protein